MPSPLRLLYRITQITLLLPQETATHLVAEFLLQRSSKREIDSCCIEMPIVVVVVVRLLFFFVGNTFNGPWGDYDSVGRVKKCSAGGLNGGRVRRLLAALC